MQNHMFGGTMARLMAMGDSGAAGSGADTKAKKDKNEETVAMQDGSVEIFVGKKQINKSFGVDETGIHAKFLFRNGTVRTLDFAPDDPILYNFAGHGVLQKFGDEMAASGDKFSLEDKIEWFDDLANRGCDTTKSVEDRWYAEREAGGGVSGVSILVRALMELRGKTAEEVKAILEQQVKQLGVTKQALVTALRASPAIKPTVDKLEAERAAKAQPVDVASVLSAFEAPAEDEPPAGDGFE